MDKKNTGIILMVLSVICAILMVASSIRGGWVQPVRTGIGYVLKPLESAVNKVSVAIFDALTDHRELQALKEENAALNKTIDELMEENTRLEEDTFELDRLRALYQLDQEYKKYKKVGARVIAMDSTGWFNVFRIDKGSNEGIQVDMNVIANGGLIGLVTEVGEDYAVVRSIIDDTSNISAMSLETQDSCMVVGSTETYDSGRLLLKDILEDSELKDGNKIVTSNISSKYLPGILIGYAADITTDSNTLTRSGYLVPVAQFNNLQEVLVITTMKK